LHPYETLGVVPSATTAEIRRAYRRLSLALHPDKNRDAEEAAAKAFGDVVKAFEILKVPDARAYFDDFGANGAGAGDGGDGGSEGFRTQWEFEMYGSAKQGQQVFYQRNPHIATLTVDNYQRRASTIRASFVIEFYAPWCKHCKTFVPTYKELAAAAAEDPGLERFEFGAVNCVLEARLCTEVFGIRSYPTVLVVNEEHGTRQEYHGDKSVDAMLPWLRRVAQEWTFLFERGGEYLVRVTSVPHYVETVLESDAFTVVGFFDGLDCQSCRTAKTNFLRVAASLAVATDGFANEGQCGADGGPSEYEGTSKEQQRCAPDFADPIHRRPVIALVNCEDPIFQNLCYQAQPEAAECLSRARPGADAANICQDLPEPPHSPVVVGFAAGPKDLAGTYLGEPLYNSNQLEQHLALEILERTLRLALADPRRSADGKKSVGVGGGAFEDDAAPDERPPPPPPMWNGPKPKQAVSWERQSRFSVGSQRQLAS